MTAIVLVTCRRWPGLSESDRLYAQALEAHGLTVRAAAWNGPAAPFRSAGAIVLRAAWDYHDDPDRFERWLESLPRAGAAVFNPPALMRWNLDKRYLIDLAERGVSLPETRVAAGDVATVQAAIAQMGSGPIVVKPSIGQSGHGVAIVDHATVPAAVIQAGGRPLILQRFVPEVREHGEVSCVFFDGQFSHAFLKRPAPGEYRVNSQYRGRVEPIELPAGIVEQAAAVLRVLPETPLYARVDGVVRDRVFLLMELELIEPALGLNLAAGAAARFAAATVRRLHQPA